MRRRVIFPNKVLPYVLLAPQLVITIIFFYLARHAGDLLFGPAAGSVRAAHPVRLAGELPDHIERRAVSRVRTGDRGVFLRRGRPLDGGGASVRGDGGPEDPRETRVPDAAHVALRGRARGGRQPLAVHLPPRDRVPGPVAERDRDALGLQAEREPGAASGHPGRVMEAGELQLPVLSGRPAGHPEVGGRGGLHGRGAGTDVLEHHLSRCSRRPPSSSWS